MTGRVQWEAQVDSNVAKLLSETKELRDQLDGIKKENYEIKLNIDNAKLEKVISNLDKMLNSLGKGTGDFKEFENLSKQLDNILSEAREISKIFKNTDVSLVADTKSLQTVIGLFGKMENHLNQIKKVFSDIGDGGEFSPLLSTIDRINASVKKLNTSIKGIGLNMNIEVGSNKELETKFQEKASKALIAYQRLFDHIKSTASSQSVFEAFNKFNLDDFDTTYGKAKAIADFIERARNDSKLLYNGHDVLKEDTTATYWNQASAAMGQATKVLKEMKASSNTNTLENLFGKTDLTEVVTQLNRIVEKLSEISSTASEFKNAFANGFNVSASVEEIEKLTSRVKELEDELSKVKVSSASLIGTNVPLGNSVINTQEKIADQVVENEKRKQEAYKATADAVMYHAGVISKLNKAETNGRFYDTNRETGYYGTGHYFVDSANKNELDKSSYSKLPYTSIDISKYDNLFKATTDELANGLHEFLKNLTKFTQGSDNYGVSELFSQFQKVFGETVMDMQEFNAKLEKLKAFMQNSSLEDRSDSVSTQFMKSLGYGGVDTRGTSFADTHYGTVIYDLKEESILQANITDELKKQGEMLDKINYKKGEAFDSNEDKKIQNILNQQAKAKEVENEFKKLYDTSTLNKYENELESVNSKIRENNEVISNCKYSIELAETEAKALAREMKQMGSSISDSEIAAMINQDTESFQRRISELEQEQSVLQKRKNEIQSNVDAEYKLANAAMERAKVIVEERHASIKDTFQGDKIQEATTSARELDRTLEQVDIPKDSFDEVINKLKLAEIKAEDIVKITKQMRIGEDGKPIESYTLKDKYGSTEIYGVSSNKEKGQLLSANYVQYDVKQAEKLQKDFNKAYEEATKINNALTETKGKLDGLSKHPELSSQFSEVKNTIKSLNAQLTQGEISVSEYNKAVKETTSNYSKLVGIQQKRDTETYNANAKQARDEAKALEQAVKQAQKLAEEKRKARQADKQATQSSVDKALKDQLDAWKTIQKIRLQIAQTDSKDTEKLHNLNEQKKALQKQYNEAGKVLKANKDLYNQTEQQVKLEHERLETNEKINKLKLNNVDVGSVLSKGDDDLKKFEARKNQSEEYRGTVEKLKQSIEELRVLEQSMVKSKLLPDGEAQKINEAVASIEEYTNAIKNMPAVEKGSDEGSRTKLANRIHEYMDKNTRMTREFREEFENLIRVLRSGDDSVNIKDIARQFEDVKFRVKEAKLEGKSFFDIFKDKAIYGYAAKLANYYLSFYDWIRYTRYAINALVELDSALLDLKKTTSMTENQLEDFYYTSNDVAKRMGVTTAEIIEQASAWSRLGYSSQEAATKMAQLSSQFASISPGMETDQAQEGLVSIMKAWDIDPDEVESEIMDNINILGNSFAESNADIVEGMKRSAAALSAVGTEYKDAFALFTGAQEILQNAEVTGRALRSISMRVRGYSESSEDGFEELDDELKNITGDLIDLTKTAEHSQGVSIFKDGSTTEFKSLVEYFGEISEIWDEMTQKQQNDFLQKAFGKTQAQAGAALIQNFEAVRDSLEVMENSAGSADREMSIVQETLEYKINALKQTWVGTVQEMIERGDLGAIIDVLTKFSEAIGKVTGTVGLGGTLGLGLGAFLGIKNIGREKCYPSSNMPIVI